MVNIKPIKVVAKLNFIFTLQEKERDQLQAALDEQQKKENMDKERKVEELRRKEESHRDKMAEQQQRMEGNDKDRTEQKEEKENVSESSDGEDMFNDTPQEIRPLKTVGLASNPRSKVQATPLSEKNKVCTSVN